jgi:hypothetical protein
VSDKVMVSVPDGNGGWSQMEGEKVDGRKADEVKQQKALEEQFYLDCEGMIGWFWKQGRLYQQENGLKEEHVAFALALLCINVRETYPKGKAEFDKISASAADYFDAAAKKK